MTLAKRCATVLAGCLLSAGIQAAPVDLGGTKLQLNGAGLRYKAVFKVYLAALYLDKKTATPEKELPGKAG
jgi:hypothetical protein